MERVGGGWIRHVLRKAGSEGRVWVGGQEYLVRGDGR